jgi:hypothetical protein
MKILDLRNEWQNTKWGLFQIETSGRWGAKIEGEGR